MNRSRLLAAAAAAAGLLAAGCDYWKNLVGEKNVTTAPLTISVLDAFTGKPLAGAHCSDADRGLEFDTDGSGSYSDPAAGTGPYRLVCGMASYYQGTAGFEAGAAGAQTAIGLARRGGDEWYPEDPEKQVRIGNPVAAFRYPGKIELEAIPADTAGRFIYEWTFANNPANNRGAGSAAPRLPRLSLDALPAKIIPGPDTVTLTVKAHPAGVEEYLVGRYRMPLEWVRNRPPNGSVSSNASVIRVGCESNKQNEYVNVFFTGSDPDPGGTCDSVVFDSRDSASSFGIQHVVAKCNDPNNYRKFELKNPFNRGQVKALYLENALSVSFWDDNGEHTDTTLRIVTRSNTVPSVTAEKTSPGRIFFTGEPVSFRITADDTDGYLKDVYFEWGNHERSYWGSDWPSLVGHMDQVVTNTTYLTEGPQQVIAYAADNCLEPSSYVLPETLDIRKNSDPVLKLTPQPNPFPMIGGIPTFQVMLDITDKDVSDQLDRFTSILFDWSDGSAMDTASTENGTAFSRLLRHTFPHDPGEGEYSLRVEVLDAHNGRAETTLAIPAYVP